MKADQAQTSQTMLYKCPGPHEIHGGRFDHTVVDDDKIEDALADGWHMTTTDAKEAHESEIEAKRLDALEAANRPTRAELEQKAKELGIEFNPTIGDKKLADRIAEKLKA